MKPVQYVLASCAAIELLAFGWLCALGPAAFADFVTAGDSLEYNRLGLELAETGTLSRSWRTIGYPLWLSLGYLAGGRTYGVYVTIAAQLLVNLVFTWGCWRLLEQVVPSASTGLRAIVTLVFFWAGLGMALYVLSDFLAAFFFAVFLYGLLFWRRPLSLLVSGPALAMATLTRPTFLLIPLILPAAAYLASRYTSKIPWQHIVVFATCSFAATGVSVARQYRAYGFAGPAPFVLTENIVTTLHQTSGTGQDFDSYRRSFEEDMARRAGRPYEALSPSDEEAYAKEIFWDEARARPLRVGLRLVRNFVNYLLVPIETTIQRITIRTAGERAYQSYVRPLLGLLCLPIWLLSLTPPLQSPRRQRTYYLLVMLSLLYVLGISAITNFAGERMRFPVLFFMMPVVLWNADYLLRRRVSA
jgi:hypothetical protein